MSQSSQDSGPSLSQTVEMPPLTSGELELSRSMPRLVSRTRRLLVGSLVLAAGLLAWGLLVRHPTPSAPRDLEFLEGIERIVVRFRAPSIPAPLVEKRAVGDEEGDWVAVAVESRGEEHRAELAFDDGLPVELRIHAGGEGSLPRILRPPRPPSVRVVRPEEGVESLVEAAGLAPMRVRVLTIPPLLGALHLESGVVDVASGEYESHRVALEGMAGEQEGVLPEARKGSFSPRAVFRGTGHDGVSIELPVDLLWAGIEARGGLLIEELEAAAELLRTLVQKGAAGELLGREFEAGAEQRPERSEWLRQSRSLDRALFLVVPHLEDLLKSWRDQDESCYLLYERSSWIALVDAAFLMDVGVLPAAAPEGDRLHSLQRIVTRLVPETHPLPAPETHRIAGPLRLTEIGRGFFPKLDSEAQVDVELPVREVDPGREHVLQFDGELTRLDHFLEVQSGSRQIRLSPVLQPSLNSRIVGHMTLAAKVPGRWLQPPLRLIRRQVSGCPVGLSTGVQGIYLAAIQ